MTADMPSLDSEYALTSDQIEAYRRDGHVLLPSFLSIAEVFEYRQAILEAVDQLKREIVPMEERDTYGKAFLQVMNLWVHDARVKQLVTSRRIGLVAAQLMGCDRARLYHDQALFKEPGGGPTPWHQDQHYWPLDTNDTITMWMPLVDVDTFMGSMRFASGSHIAGYFGDFPISDESERRFEQLVTEHGYQIVESGAMKAGDATFHSGWTLHAASANSSEEMREAMTAIYFPGGTRVGPIDNANRQADLDAWLPGLQPGDLAASELNPVI